MTTALEEGEGSASRPGCSLPPGKTWYSLYRRLGGPPGPIWTAAENLAPTGIRFPDRPARSQLLHWLSYPAHLNDCNAFKMSGTACIVMQHHIQENVDFHIQHFLTLDAGFQFWIIPHNNLWSMTSDRKTCTLDSPCHLSIHLIIGTHLSNKLDNPAQPQATAAAVSWRVEKFNFLQRKQIVYRCCQTQQ